MSLLEMDITPYRPSTSRERLAQGALVGGAYLHRGITGQLSKDIGVMGDILQKGGQMLSDYLSTPKEPSRKRLRTEDISNEPPGGGRMDVEECQAPGAPAKSRLARIPYRLW